MRPWDAAVDFAAELLLAAGFLYGMDAFAHLKLTPAGFALLLAGWAVARAAASSARARTRLPPVATEALEVGGMLAWVAAANGGLKQPWTAPQALYATAFLYVLWRVWRWLVARAEAAGANRGAEQLRLLLVGAAAGAVMLPFISDLQFGGGDSRWYTSVFIDFLQQLRHGVFPVFLGQGELSFNGSANLFRSAPLCLWIGGAWDVATAQALSPVAVRNLAVLTAALAAGLGMYAVLLGLRRLVDVTAGHDEWGRWLAMGGAVLYVLCPGVLLPLYYYELQMTFTALLALPWIFYGNLRTMLDDGGGGYVELAVGLTLAWLAHAPLAIIAMLCTAALQLGRFMFEPEAIRRQWRPAAGGAVLFALLSAYYFLGMSELDTGARQSLRNNSLFFAGFIVLLGSGVQVIYFRRWPWAAGLAAGAALVTWANPAWWPLVATWLVLWAGLVIGARLAGIEPDRAQAALLATAALMIASAVAQVWIASHPRPANLLLVRELARVAAARRELFQPVSPKLGNYGDCQPGYALWALAAVLLATAWRARSVALANAAAVAGLLVLFILAVPRASDFLAGYGPGEIGNLVNLPMLYRLVPPLAALLVVAGFMALVLGCARGRWRRRLAVAGMLAALVWSGAQARRIVGPMGERVASRASTEQEFSPDYFALGRYPYLMLYVPSHFMDGIHFAWMDSRLLTRHFDLITGPDEIARQMEGAGEEVLPLTSRQDDSYPEWLRFNAEWDVQPGETRLLRFEFAPDLNCSGWLIMSSERIYQEHYINPSDLGYGFGAGPHSTHTLAVANHGAHREHFTLRMKMDTGNTLPRDGGRWGTLHLSRYVDAAAPVQIKSLVPYQAQVAMPEDGYFESPRQWIEGYRLWVDGKEVPPVRLKSGMLGTPLKAGDHELVLKFTGSFRLWLGLWISATTLLGLVIGSLVRDRRRRQETWEEYLAWQRANQG
ncbi:MAG TPA: hypothetical protein VHD61_05215 [Lacunisphaera sp.]|nr:hypothetical protein [Lacunisphaera sp.]